MSSIVTAQNTVSVSFLQAFESDYGKFKALIRGFAIPILRFFQISFNALAALIVKTEQVLS